MYQAQSPDRPMHRRTGGPHNDHRERTRVLRKGESKRMTKRSSRREFLSTAVKLTAGAGLGAASMNLVASQQGRAAAGTPPWPWPYQKLDAESVRKLGHQGFYEQGRGCGYGAFKAIIAALQKKVGHPFTQMPPEMMIYGHGGAVEWGTLCGALNGAAAAMSLVTDKETADKLIHELLGWYTKARFPSEQSNRYAQSKGFLVEKYSKPLPQSAAGSPLCHASVTGWCKASGFTAASQERKERCARLTGDVAAYAVELLNKHADAKFKGAFTVPASVQACQTCHGPTNMDNVKTNMNCTQCHEPNWKHP
jgi:hypothetical protein